MLTTSKSIVHAAVGAFSGMGNEYGWENWTENASEHLMAIGAATVHEYQCPRSLFEQNIRQNSNLFYYHLCHGSSTAYLSGDSRPITSRMVETWMSARSPMRFTFIGSCGGMEQTGEGTLCQAFSRGDARCAVVGYVRMGERGSGWCVSLPWQDAFFTLAIDDAIPVYEALLRVQTQYPQMSRNWGFWGNKQFMFNLVGRTSRLEGGVVMWKRAKIRDVHLSSAELEQKGMRVLSEHCGPRQAELHLASAKTVTEEDTGAKRYLLHYGRRVNDIPVLEDYVSVELDPSDGELIGYHQAFCEKLPEAIGRVHMNEGQAFEVAKGAVERLLQDNRIGYEPGSVKVEHTPYLAYTSRIPFVVKDRILAYVVPVLFTRAIRVESKGGNRKLIQITKRETETAILIDPADGAIIGLIPPPPV